MIAAVTCADERYQKAMEYNARTARKKGGVDRVYMYSVSDIDPEFREKNRHILSQPRGNGYWLWKPYFIARTLRLLQEGDYLVYCDAGIYYNASVKKLIHAMARSKSGEQFVLENEDKYKYHCTACGKGFVRQKDNFSVSPSPYYKGNNGYLHICKRCLEKAFIYYRDEMFDGNQDRAMEFLCATINTCFDESAWANAKKHPSKGSKVSVYFSKLNLSQTKGSSYADTVMLREANKIENASSIQQVEDSQDNTVPIETVRLFGLGLITR